MNMRPVGAKLLRAWGRVGERTDGRTHDEANSRFSQFFEKALKT
jgi:predicted DNA-binding WGR domain protein